MGEEGEEFQRGVIRKHREIVWVILLKKWLTDELWGWVLLFPLLAEYDPPSWHSYFLSLFQQTSGFPLSAKLILSGWQVMKRKSFNLDCTVWSSLLQKWGRNGRKVVWKVAGTISFWKGTRLEQLTEEMVWPKNKADGGYQQHKAQAGVLVCTKKKIISMHCMLIISWDFFFPIKPN